MYAANEMNPVRPSVYISLEPYASRTSYGACVSLTGQQKDVFGRHSIDMRMSKDGDWDNFVYFNLLYGKIAELFGLDLILYSGVQEAVNRDRLSEASVSENTHFEPGSSPIIAFAGATKYWSAKDRDYTLTSPAQGFIPTAWYGVGLRDTLNGKMELAPSHEHQLLVQ